MSYREPLQTLKCFIEAGSVLGEWQLEARVPIPNSTHTRWVDGICVLSRKYNEPRVRALDMLISLDRNPLNLRNKRPSFDNERVALVEIKSGQSGINDEAIGQLLVYSQLFAKRWPTASVDQLWLIGERRPDPGVQAIASCLGITIWSVPGGE